MESYLPESASSSELNDEIDWSMLPPLLVLDIFALLDFKSKVSASKVCHAWNNLFHDPLCWRSFVFKFCREGYHQVTGVDPLVDAAGRILAKHHSHLKHVTIKMNPSNSDNVNATEKLLSLLVAYSHSESDPESPLKLKSLKIIFTNYRTMHRKYQQIGELVHSLLAKQKGLDMIDFSKFNMPLDDKMITQLYSSNPNVSVLRIANDIAMTILTADCVLKLLQHCRRIETLSIPYVCLPKDAFLVLCREDRARIKSLTLKCTRQDKYVQWIEPDTWALLCSAHPDLRIGFAFDETTLYSAFDDMMTLAFLPVSFLDLSTYTMLHEQLSRIAVQYKDTLTHLIVAGQEGAELDNSLIAVANSCQHLIEVTIKSSVGEAVKRAFIQQHVLTKPQFTLLLHNKELQHVWALEHITEDHPLTKRVLQDLQTAM